MMKKRTLITTVLGLLLISSCNISYSQQLSPFSHDGKIGYVDQNMRVVIEPRYLSSAVFNPEGYTIARVSANYYQAIDKTGREIFGTTTLQMFDLGEGLIAYQTEDGLKIVDIETGAFVAEGFIPTGFPASDGIIPVWLPSDPVFQNYIDRHGNVLFANKKFRRTYEFSEGFAVVIHLSGYSGFINHQGDFASEPNFRRLGFHFSEGLTPAQAHDETTGYVRPDGTFAFEVPLVSTDYISVSGTDFENGFAIIHTNENPSIWRVINKDGEFVSDEIHVLSARDFREGFSKVTVRHGNSYRYGYVDTKGNYLHPPTLEAISPFMTGDFINGFAIVTVNQREGLLDTKGVIYWSDEIMGSR